MSIICGIVARSPARSGSLVSAIDERFNGVVGNYFGSGGYFFLRCVIAGSSVNHLSDNAAKWVAHDSPSPAGLIDRIDRRGWYSCILGIYPF